MGRYFKTADSTFVDDIVYKAPYELMARALQSKDLQAKEDEAEIDAFDILGDDKNYTEKDKAKRNQILDEYRGQAHSIAEEIQKNPTHKSFYMRKINAARKKFDKELKTGFLNNADLNYATREKTRAGIEARKDITDEQKKVALDQLDHEFQGSDAEEGNTFSDNFHVYEALDEEKFIQTKKSELTADAITTKTNRTDGRYFTTSSGQRKFIDDKRLDESFENSTGVAKWEKALLQKLDWQTAQGKITEDERNQIFSSERETFKQDYINSLGFEQKTTADDILSRDGTWHADQANAIAWTRMNRVDALATQDTQVELDEITTSGKESEKQTFNEKLNNKYNIEGQKIKEKLGDNFPAIQNSLQSGDKAAKREAISRMKEEGYSPTEIMNLRGYIANKKRIYEAVPTKTERRGYLEVANNTPDNSYVNVKYTNEEGVDVIEEMPLHQARELGRETVSKTVKKDVPATMIHQGKTVVAYKGSSGKLVPLTTSDKNTVSLESYNPNGNYMGNKKAALVKQNVVEDSKKDYSLSKATVTTSDVNYKFDNPYSEPTKTKVVNYHTIKDGREYIISVPIDTNKANILNKSE